MHQSLLRGEVTFKKAEGIDRRYVSVKDEHQPEYMRRLDKPEAGVLLEPEGTMRFAPEVKEKVDVTAYEK